MLTVVLVALLAWIVVSVPMALVTGALLRRRPAPVSVGVVRAERSAPQAS